MVQCLNVVVGHWCAAVSQVINIGGSSKPCISSQPPLHYISVIVGSEITQCDSVPFSGKAVEVLQGFVPAQPTELR